MHGRVFYPQKILPWITPTFSFVSQRTDAKTNIEEIEVASFHPVQNSSRVDDTQEPTTEEAKTFETFLADELKDAAPKDLQVVVFICFCV